MFKKLFILMALLTACAFGQVVIDGVPATVTGLDMPTQSTLSYYGADSTGVADSTTAVQNWINYGTNTAGGGYGNPIICNVPGTYKITGNILVANVLALNVFSNGCTFSWAGNNSTPMFTYANVAWSYWQGGKITAGTGTPLAEAFRLTNQSGFSVAPSGDRWDNVVIDGVAGHINYCWRNATGTGGDNNVSEMKFYSNICANYGVSMFSIEGSQAVNWVMYGNQSNGDGYGQYTVSGGASAGAAASFVWNGGFFGGNTVADFRIGQPASPGEQTVIENMQETENSNRFLMTDATGSGTPVYVLNVNWSSNNLNADGKIMILQSPGPFGFEHDYFGSNGATAMTVVWGGYTIGGTPPILDLIDTTFVSNKTTTATLFPNSPPTLATNSYIAQSGTVFEAITGQNLAYNASTYTATAIGLPTTSGVTPVGTTGTCSWGYAVDALDKAGKHTAISATAVSITQTSNCTLNSSNYNNITINGWGKDADKYEIRRTIRGSFVSTGPTYSSGGTATGTGTCVVTFSGHQDTGGIAATGTVSVSSGVISGAVTITNGGSGYTGVPTSGVLSLGTASSCSGTATFTGGAFTASTPSTVGLIATLNNVVGNSLITSDKGAAGDGNIAPSPNTDQTGFFNGSFNGNGALITNLNGPSITGLNPANMPFTQLGTGAIATDINTRTDKMVYVTDFLSPNESKQLIATVTGASNTSPIVITASNSFANGDHVFVTNVSGNTAANGLWVVSNVSSSTFTLTGSTGNGAWTSGGTVYSDATTGVQNFINAVVGSPLTANHGGLGYCPNGIYYISSTILVANSLGFRMLASEGCNMAWTNSTGGPMFDWANMATSIWDGGEFSITPYSPSALNEVFRIESRNDVTVPANVNPSQDRWANIRVDGYDNTHSIAIAFRDYIGTGGDNNVDFMSFEHVRCVGYTLTCVSIEGTQATGYRFIDFICQAYQIWSTPNNSTGNPATPSNINYCISGVGLGAGTGSKSYFTWEGGFSGSNGGADFLLGAPSSPGYGYIIANFSSEQSSRFFVTQGGAVPVTIDTSNWTSYRQNPDNIPVKIPSSGPIIFKNSTIGTDYGVPTTIQWDPGANFTPGSFTMEGSFILSSLTTTGAIFGQAPPTNVIDSYIQIGNLQYVPIIQQNGAYNASTFQANKIVNQGIFDVIPTVSGTCNWQYAVDTVDKAGNHTTISGSIGTTPSYAGNTLGTQSGSCTLDSGHKNGVLVIGTGSAYSYEIRRTVRGSYISAGPTYSSGGTATGTGTCIATAVNTAAIQDVGGLSAVGTVGVASGVISGALTMTTTGSGYISVPTSWTLTTGTASSCSGTITTTGGTRTASVPDTVGLISTVTFPEGYNFQYFDPGTAGDGNVAPSPNIDQTGSVNTQNLTTSKLNSPGIYCDGVFNNTSALSTAIATGNPVRLPPGTCMFTTLTISTAGVTIEGSGKNTTILKVSSSQTYGINITANNITIRDLTVDANNFAGTAINVSGTLSGTALLHIGAKNATTGSGIAAGAASNFLVSDCDCTGNGGNQLTIAPAVGTTYGNVIIENSLFDPIAAGSHTFVTLYAWEPASGTASTGTGLVIRNNTIKYYSRGGTETDGLVCNGGSTNYAGLVSIIGNHIISDTVVNTASNALEDSCALSEIIGNEIEAAWFGINVGGTPYTDQNTIIQGNNIKCTTGLSTCTSGTLVQLGGSSGTMTGNILYSTTHSYGIQVQTGHWTIANNVLDCSTCAVVNLSTASLPGVIVSNNDFKNCTYGILTGGNPQSGVTITGNTFTSGCFYAFYSGATSYSNVVLSNNQNYGSVPYTSPSHAGLQILDDPAFLPQPSLNVSSCTGATLGGSATNGGGLITGLPGSSCTIIITFSVTAKKNWGCTVRDVTTPSNTFTVTGAPSATTCTLSGTSSASDQLYFTANQQN